MKILALESSAKAASCAILSDGELLASAWQATGLTHSRTLLPMVEDMLKNSELSVQEMDAVAVAAGPGSFTGLRIGIAAVKGLAWAAEKPCKMCIRDSIRCERSYGSFSRSFDISGIQGEDISAAYADGVLTLTLPKQNKAVPASRRLEIQ